MSNRIVVVGSINLDMVMAVRHLPLHGETVSASSLKSFCGGKGANQAVAAARLGASVRFIGKVGGDSFGKQLKLGLLERGVGIECLQTTSGSSGLAFVMRSDEGENSIVIVSGANSELLPADLEGYKSEITRARIVLSQLEIPISTVEYLGALTKVAGIPLMLDPAPAQPLSPNIIEAVTWLTPNESEAQTLLREKPGELQVSQVKTIAKRLLEMGPRNVAIKLGAKGAYLAGLDISEEYITSPSVQAVDTTGAGDAFNGAFAYGLADGMTAIAAARFACEVAASSVTKHGAQASMPSMQELQRFSGRQQ